METDYQLTVPPSLRFYLQNPEIPTLIHAGSDLDAFLGALTDCVGGAPPYILYFDRRPYLVIAFHAHSGGVCAVELSERPAKLRFGDADFDRFDFEPYDESTIDFEQWVDNVIRHGDLDSYPLKSRAYPVRLD